jgi:hypothetical protein
MALTAFNVLVLVALVLTLISGITGRVPVFVPLLLICIALLVGR